VGLEIREQFLAQVSLYVVAPVAAVLATQFPALSQWLFTFLQATGR